MFQDSQDLHLDHQEDTLNKGIGKTNGNDFLNEDIPENVRRWVTGQIQELSRQVPKLKANGGLAVGTVALATTATDGFVYIPTCAGTPTGVPTASTGTVAVVYDTTNNIIYVYNGAWKKTVALT